ncbi:MAG: DUF2225 domain-containing protein [Clostridiales bacterium]|nr:DUF2225 domain-containing protein [Clostridiales bacterium]
MTLPVYVTVKCSVCGKESRQRVLASTSIFGSPDLDLRPAELKRSTMHYWVQECPHCGYVAERLDQPVPVSREKLEDFLEKYCERRWFSSELAEQFHKQYWISRLKKDHESAFAAALHAAWACDDAEDRVNAVYCRKCALEELEQTERGKKDENAGVQRLDLLRRAGLFDQVLRESEDLHFEQEVLQKIADFQAAKAKEKDAGCYRVEDVLTKKEPAV